MAIGLKRRQNGSEVSRVGAPAPYRTGINGLGHILIGWRIEPPALLMEAPLLVMPVQSEEPGHTPALFLHIGHGVFVARLQPGESFPIADRQPNVHQIGVVVGESLEAEE